MMSPKEDARTSATILKALREEHQETVARAQALVKENNAIQRKLLKAFGEETRTIPQLAEETGIPAQDVLWHITALKKYDRIIEVGMDGEYYSYRTSKEGK